MLSGFHLKLSPINKRALSGAVLLWLTIAFLATSSPISAQEYIELTPELDARAADLYGGIMCPICNGQTISQSHAAISETMRQIVRERLVAGDTDSQVYDFMTDAFGRDILASPPKEGIALAVWVVPPIAILLGGFAVTLFVRRLKAAAKLVADSDVPVDNGDIDDALEPYLRIVDAEIPEFKERS